MIAGRLRALAVLLALGAPCVSLGAERPLPRDEAIALALERNEDIFIERESLSAAESAVTFARGAYDPLLELDAGWHHLSPLLNSSFSGAPPDRPTTTTQGYDLDMALRQLFASGGTATLHAGNLYDRTDSQFALRTPAYSTRVGVELRQPLLRNLAVDAARTTVRVARAEREGAFAAVRRTITETVAEVERAYWTLAAARRALTVRAESVRLAEEQAQETRSRVEGGVAPETENAQPKAELERRRGELLTTREAVARADHALKNLILAGVDDPLWVEDLAPVEDLTVDPAPVDLPVSLARALERRPELGVAGATLQRRRLETALAQNGVRPALDAVVSYDRFGFAGTLNPSALTFAPPGTPAGVRPGQDGGLRESYQNLADGDFADTRAGIVLGIPIGNREAKAAAARAGSFERAAQADLEKVRKSIRVEVQDAATALDTTRARIEAARAAMEAAEVQLGAERERYAVGFSTNFLVLTRQNELSTTRLDLISAYADYQMARTEMARATGSLLEERSIAVERAVP